MFQGSIVALVTPMQPDGQVDYPALERLVDFHVDNGTSAIVAVGTTGESATLPFAEHINVVKQIVVYADGRIPVIAGSGANATSEAIELSQAMEDLGISAFLTVVPYYNKPQQEGMVAHFNAIADATDIPNILYNVPSRTVADLLPDTVAELAKHRNIIGIKDATGDLNILAELKAKTPKDFVLLSGDDATGMDFMLQGGHGVISVTTNVVPKAMAELCAAALSGDAEKARAVNAKIAELHTGLFIEPNPVMPKYCLQQMGLIPSAFVRLPLVEAKLSAKERIQAMMQQAGVIQE